MIKRTFAATVISIAILSCNNNVEKAGNKKEDSVKEPVTAGQSDRLVYLDTARNLYNLLCQDWVMEDDAEALADKSEDSKFEIPYRSFFMAPNGTFIKNPRNAMDYGNWQYNDADKTVSFTYTSAGGKDIYKIAEVGPDQLKLKNMGINTNTILQFVSSGKRFKDPNEDPWYIDNNRWRIKPSKKESGEEVHQRLKENLYFFVLFYKSVLLKDDKLVSFWGLPSCFKWYGGGIFLKKKDELKENWINCFYNKDQALQAYALADKLLQQKYNWPKGEQNWLKLNLAVLEQMYKKIDEIH